MRKPTPEFLLIDIGNSRLKRATARSRGPIRVAGDIATKAATSAWIRALARKFSGHRLVLASVVPKLTPVFQRPFSKRIEIVTGNSHALGLIFNYPRPSEIGADRVAAAVAAQTLGQYPAIIIACGTATAFTVLDAKGRLCGGAIAPGPQAQLAALLGATAQLPAITLRPPRSALARSTENAIRAGVMFSFQGGVKEILHKLLKILPARPKPNVILTGGNAHLLANKLGPRVKPHPLLVFEGLRIIGSRLFVLPP